MRDANTRCPGLNGEKVSVEADAKGKVEACQELEPGAHVEKNPQPAPRHGREPGARPTPTQPPRNEIAVEIIHLCGYHFVHSPPRQGNKHAVALADIDAVGLEHPAE